MKQRRSLTNIGGAVATWGDPELSRALASALDVGAEEEVHRAHVHGFHTYPARMHPVTAARLVRALTPERGRVLDPFCGSGTVIVEAMLAGRDAFGTDLNPLAVELTRLKTTPRTDEELARLVECARAAAAVAEERRAKKAGASRRFPREDTLVFAPHTLLELDGIRLGIEEQPKAVARALKLVLSSILVKVSKKTGDTTEVRQGRPTARSADPNAGEAPKRIAAGYPAKLFVKKTTELAGRLAEFRDMLPKPAPRARAEVEDATVLEVVPRESADAIITSPPYVATYDYLAHHELRMRWLGLDTRAFARGEMGARRRYADLPPDEARATWERELARFLRAAGRVLRPKATLALLIADSAVGGAALRADELVGRAAERERFELCARAAQERPHFHRPTMRAFASKPRQEHLLLLRRRAQG
jgi:DNA modification methylase